MTATRRSILDLLPGEEVELGHAIAERFATLARRLADALEHSDARAETKARDRTSALERLAEKIEEPSINPVDGGELPVFCRSRSSTPPAPVDIPASEIRVGDKVLVPSLIQPSKATRVEEVEDTKFSVRVRFEGYRGDVMIPKNDRVTRY